MYSNDIKSFREFGFTCKDKTFPYSESINLAIVEAIHHNQTRMTTYFFGPIHQEVQHIDFRTYLVEKSMTMQYDQNESFYGLSGKKGDEWFQIVPDIEYPEFVVEYTNNDKIVHSCRAEGIRMMTKTGVLVIRPKENFIKIQDMHDPTTIRRMGQLCESNRRSTIHHIPFGVQYYYSKKNNIFVSIRKEDIHLVEERGPYIIDSDGEKIMLASIELFEVFSPEERKRESFNQIRGELIEKSHHPDRFVDWCLDEEDRSRISRFFII